MIASAKPQQSVDEHETLCMHGRRQSRPLSADWPAPVACWPFVTAPSVDAGARARLLTGCSQFPEGCLAEWPRPASTIWRLASPPDGPACAVKLSGLCLHVDQNVMPLRARHRTKRLCAWLSVPPPLNASLETLRASVLPASYDLRCHLQCPRCETCNCTETLPSSAELGMQGPANT